MPYRTRPTASTARSPSSTTWRSTPIGRARTPTACAGDDSSYRAQLDYTGDRYGLQLDHLAVGDNFRPEIGYVRRDDIRRSLALARFSPRPRNSRLVRKYSYTGTLVYAETGAGRLDTRDWRGEFAVEFHSSDRFTASYGPSSSGCRSICASSA